MKGVRVKEINVLIVDDMPEIRSFIRGCLEINFPHIAVHDTGSGKGAIARLEKGSFHLVLCDWELPDVNGDEVLSWVRTSSHRRDIPFIMVTSNGGREYIERARQLGVTAYITKPVDCKTLTGTVLDALDAAAGRGDGR